MKNSKIQYVAINGILTLAVANLATGEVEFTAMGTEVPWDSKLQSASTEAEIWGMSLDLLLGE